VPEEGGVLRVWALEGDAVLGLMRFSWFRFKGSSQGEAEAASTQPSAATGGTTQIYKWVAQHGVYLLLCQCLRPCMFPVSVFPAPCFLFPVPCSMLSVLSFTPVPPVSCGMRVRVVVV
jgi:hypothetical protein